MLCPLPQSYQEDSTLLHTVDRRRTHTLIGNSHDEKHISSSKHSFSPVWRCVPRLTA